MTLDREPIAPGALLAELVHEWDVRFAAGRRDVDDRRRATTRRRSQADQAAAQACVRQPAFRTR